MASAAARCYESVYNSSSHFFPTAPSVTEVPCVSVGQTQTWGSFTAGPCLSAARAAQECRGLLKAAAADGTAKARSFSHGLWEGVNAQNTSHEHQRSGPVNHHELGLKSTWRHGRHGTAVPLAEDAAGSEAVSTEGRRRAVSRGAELCGRSLEAKSGGFNLWSCPVGVSLAAPYCQLGGIPRNTFTMSMMWAFPQYFSFPPGGETCP